MAEGTIDRLEIEIVSDSTGAATSLDAFAASITKLGTATSTATPSLQKLQTAISGIGKAASSLNLSGLSNLQSFKLSASSVTNLTKLSSAVNMIPSDTSSRVAGLTTLNSLGEVKVSSTIAKNLSAIAEAVNGISEGTISKLSSLTTSLSSMSALKGVSLTGITNGLARLPAVMQEFSTLDVSAFTQQIDQLSASLSALVPSVSSLSAAINSLPTSLRTVGMAARSVTSANTALATATDAATTSTTGFSGAMDTLWVAMKGVLSVSTLIRLVMKVADAIGDCITAISDYTEAMNLFTVSLGEYAEAAYEYAEEVHDALGINIGEWAEVLSVLDTIIEGFGIASDTAYTMSTNLTQLAYDIASYYNLSIEEATEKVRAGLVGEVEPMRAIGYSLTTTDIDDAAAALGIEKTASEMTTAEKAMMRYYLMMNTCTEVQTDMARTLTSPANQLRVLESAVTTAAQAIGNLFIPILNKVLPIVIAIVQAVTQLAQSIADFFGFDITYEVDYTSTSDSVSSVADDYDDVTDATDSATAAAEEYKNTVMGFDELNKLNDVSESSGSSGSGDSSDTSSILDSIPITTYDFLDGIDTALSDAIDEAAEMLESILEVVAEIGAAFLLWKLGSIVSDILGLDTNLGAILAGVYLVITGLDDLQSALDDINSTGLDWENIFNFAAASAEVVVGGAMIGSQLLSGIKTTWTTSSISGATSGALLGAFAALAVVGGITLVTGITDEIENGFSWEACFENVVGGAELGASIGGFVAGPAGAIIGALGGAISGLLVTMVLDWDGFCDSLADYFDENGSALFGGVAASVVSVFASSLSAALGASNSTAIGQAAAGATLFITGVFDQAANGFSWTSFLETLVGGIGTGASIGTAIAPGIGTLVGAILGAIASILAECIVDWDGFSSAITDAIEYLQNLNWNELAWEYIIEPFLWGMVAVLQFTMDVGESIATFVSDFIGSIQDAFGDWYDSLSDTGKECIDGLLEGISTAISDIGTWLSDNVVEPFLTAFKDLFGIASPSTVMAEVGGYVMEGFFGGISDLASDIGSSIGEAVDGVVTWFDDNLVSPLGEFFSGLWEDSTDDAETGATNMADAFDDTAGWFETNVTDPVSEFFSGAWDDVTEASETAWEGVSDAFDEASGWFETNVTDPVMTIFSEAFESVSDDGGLSFGTIQETFEKLSNWFSGTVTQPIMTLFETMATAIGDAASTAWTSISGVFEVVEDWFNNNVVGPVKTAFSGAWDSLYTGAKTAWENIQSVFSGLTAHFKTIFSEAWNAVVNVFSNVGSSGNNIASAIESAFKKVANNLIGGINKVIAYPFNKINSIITTLRSISIAGISPFSGLSTISVPSISYLASGGILDDGQLFVARESGPEMVGTLGGSTAVANNDQIVEGIESGVYRAVVSAMSIASSTTSGDGKTVTVTVNVDSQELARAVYKGQQQLTRRGELKMAFV